MGDERAHYDWDTTAHAHIRCVRCNKVEDMMNVDLHAIADMAGKASAYQITGQQITFEGVCPECAKKKVTNRRPLRILMQGVLSKIEWKGNLMFIIGSHLSISKGYLHMGKEATKIGGQYISILYAQSARW